MSRRVPRRPMTDGELALIRALAGCRFAPATTAKRFAREMAWAAAEAQPEITESQAAFLRRLVTMYRRQIRANQLPWDVRYLLTPGAQPPAPPRPEPLFPRLPAPRLPSEVQR